MEELDYLLIGHISKDLTPDGPVLGGTVTYSSLTANALGLRAGIVTSVPASLAPLLEPLQDVAMQRIPADQPTTFRNEYTPEGRIQTITGLATALDDTHIPLEWRSAPIVHLAPIAQEVDPQLVKKVKAELLAVTPQGWMRDWDGEGRVSYRRWTEAEFVLPRSDVAIISEEDIEEDPSQEAVYASLVPVLVVTRGKRGCTVYIDGTAHHVPGTAAKQEIDPTGAGDIFSASFITRLHATGNPLTAAEFANELASRTVARRGLAGIPTSEEARDVLRKR